MKKGTTTTRRLALAAFLGMSTLAVVSCNSNKPEDPKDVAEEVNDERFDERAAEKDAQFLVEAASINMEEIQLGELAEQKGMATHVKDLGKMMVEQHTKAMNDLKELASKKTITLPTALTDEGQNAYDDLNKESGKDFDKDYCDKMVKGHENAIDKFEKAAADSKDPDIRNWASSMLPSLRAHLDHAKNCQEQCKAAK